MGARVRRNTLVYSAQSTSVDTVLVDGEIVLQGGRATRLDMGAELLRVDAAAAALRQRMGWPDHNRWPLVR